MQTALDNSQVTSSSYYKQYVTVLCQYRIFLLKGRDSETFLQGQLCGDIREVSPTQSLLTAHCTPKGRVYASLTLAKHPDGWLAIVPQSNATDLLDRLQKYILFSKLSITDVSADYALIECTGADTAKALSKQLSSLPEQVMAAVTEPTITAIRQPGDLPRWLLCCSNNEIAIDIWSALSATHQPLHPTAHDTQNLLAGYVCVGQALQEAFLPQMIGLDHFDGLSFKKGCYVGQEVIARTAHLGKLKKNLYRGSVPASTGIQIGSDIVNEAGTVLGTCAGTESAQNPEGKHTLIAIITKRGLDAPLFCADQPISDIEKRFV